MNDTLLQSQERKRLRELNKKFYECMEKFGQENDATQEEEVYLLKEYFLKEIMQEIDLKLLNTYKMERKNFG